MSLGTSFLKQMFDVIQRLPLDDKRRVKLTAARDNLMRAIFDIHDLPSYEHMSTLNCCWTLAHWAMDECQPSDPTPPRAGAGEKEVERKVA